MVRIPNSPHEWVEHVHTTGRKFLSNVSTSETRWLWTKWDMNGRLFVRNTMDPNRRVWVDEMDLPMRIESGTASPFEIQQYAASLSKANSNSSQTLANPANSVSTASHLQSQIRNPQRPHYHQPQPKPQQQQYQIQPQPTKLPSHHSHDPSHRDPFSSSLPPNESLSPYQHHRPFVVDSKTSRRVQKRDRATRFGSERKASGTDFQSPSGLLNATVVEPTVKPFAFHGATPVQQPRSAQNLQTLRTPPNSSELPSTSSEAAPLKRPTYASSLTVQPHPAPSLPKRRRFDPVHRTSPPAVSSLRPLTYVPCSVQKLHDSSASFRHHHVPARVYYDRIRGSSAPEGSASTLDPGADEVYLYEPIVGTCEEKEKEYLRLTSAPKPEAVRPPRVLRLSLAHVKSIWADGSRDYGWVCRQLKSIRQDYTVQAVTDQNVVDVYKTHARIALENGDLGEFNTCVAQVQRLFDKVDRPTDEHDEFATYRILYSVITSAKAWQVQREFAKLSPKQRQWTGVQFAWQICLAVKRDDYHDYFRRAARPPKHTVAHFLLVHLDRRMRHLGIRAMVAAYGPGQPALLPLRFVAVELGWASRDSVNGPCKKSSFVLPEKVVGSDDQNVLGVVQKLGLIREPVWVYQAVGFLASINVDLVADDGVSARSIGGSRANSVFIDCRSTKSHGVGELKTNGKLITHAGSVSRSWS